MKTSTSQSFFLVLLKDSARTRLKIALDEASIAGESAAAGSPEDQGTVAPVEAQTFAEVFRAFGSVMRTYRNFLQLNLTLAARLSSSIAERTMTDFANAKGTKRDDLSGSDRIVFEMKNHTLRELTVHQEEIIATLSGAALLPEVMLIGLISAYDAFLSNLLRVIFLRHPEMILTSEKTIKFSELAEFDSIEEARISLLDREIESVLRESHQEHFKWMESKFGMTLTQNLPALSKFVEICERRNLLTHTGGIVSAKYVANCQSNALPPDIKVGSKLTVDVDYYSAAVDIVCEIGMKLCWVLWRKFSKDEKEMADRTLNETCYNLIVRRRYSVAEAILSFSSDVLKKSGGNDRCRRMMRVNLANSIRLQDRQEEAVKVLNADDWSASNDEFAVSVAAVRGDIGEVVRLMRKIGPNSQPNAEDYRTWPVFRRLRGNTQFADAFESIFGEPVVSPKEPEVTPSPTQKSLH